MVYIMVFIHFTMRTHGVNQTFRFVKCIWLHRKSRQIRFFLRKKTLFSSFVRNVKWATILYKNHCVYGKKRRIAPPPHAWFWIRPWFLGDFKESTNRLLHVLFFLYIENNECHNGADTCIFVQTGFIINKTTKIT